MGLLRNEVILSMNDEEIQNVGNEATETTAVETPSVGENATQGEEEVQSNDGQQEQFNKVIQERLKRQKDTICKKYGAKDEAELDMMFEKAKDYDELKNSYESALKEIGGYKETALLQKHAILENKQDDVRTYFKGKGLELNEENLKNVLETHPEWLPQKANETTFVPIGGERQDTKKDNEEERALKLFGLDRFVK